MHRELNRSLSALLCTCLCLLLVSAPAFAGATDRSYVAGHFVMELASDAGGLLEQFSDDPLFGKLLDKSEQKQLQHLLGNPVTENLVLVGDIRAKALAKKKPVPEFAKIAVAKERTNDEMVAWSEESLAVLEMLRENLEDKEDSLKEMSDEQMLQLQQMMDKIAQLEQMISKVMKAAAESQSGVAGNLKAS